MSTCDPAPRRIVTANVALPTDTLSHPGWEPAVDISEEDVPRVALLEDQAAKYPIFTHMQVPVNANGPWKPQPASSESIPHQGVNIQFLDLAPGAKVPFHRTTSIDYMIFISGEVILRVPHVAYDPKKGLPPRVCEIKCRPGDIVVQRGTLHSWENPSETEWARYIGVGVRSEPLEVNVGEPEEGLKSQPLLPAWY